MPSTEIDTSAAQAYENYLVTNLFGPWALRVVEQALPMAGQSVLDVACGTGIGARLVAPCLSPGGKIISTDIDPAMIAVAQSTLAGIALPAEISLEWHVTPAEQLDIQEESIDLCLCLQGPQFLDDPAAGMAQIFRSLKIGGTLAASMWNEYWTNKGHYAIGQALQSRGLKPAIKPFSLGAPDQAKTLFEQTGFELEYFETEHLIVPFRSAKEFVEAVAAGAPATRHALAQLAAADLEAFISDVEKLLSPYQTVDGLELPTSAHVVVARKPL